MGSYKSLIELNPLDLFNTDRHVLGPENPAHNVSIDAYYIDIYEVTHGSYMEFIEGEGYLALVLGLIMDMLGISVKLLIGQEKE